MILSGVILMRAVFVSCPTGGARMTFIYDGDCGFCSSFATWIRRRLPPDVAVVAWQDVDDLNGLGLTHRDVTQTAWWFDREKWWAGSEAIGKALVVAGGLWRGFGGVLLRWPISIVARWASA